jgi:polysaccharide pyruvyl transferase WcaK-like protein
MQSFYQKQSVEPLVVNLLGVTYNTNNYGVRVLLSAVVDSLTKLNQNINIRILDYGHNPIVWTEKTAAGDKSLPLINLRFSWKLHLPNNIIHVLFIALFGKLIIPNKWRDRLWNRNPWLRKILKGNVNLSLAGGDSFSDIYGFERLIYVLLPQILVIILGKPLVLLPQTFGPFKNRTSRVLARFVLQHAKLVYSRDREGITVVNKLLGWDDPKVQFGHDLGFAMEPEPVDETTMSQVAELRRNGPLVGLNISSLLHMGGYTHDNMFGLRQNYPELIQILLDFLIQKMHCRILLVPHVYGGLESVESEVTLYRRLLPEFDRKYPGKVFLIDKVFTHRQVKSIIGQCDLLIGSRMHACIAALSQFVPTIALAYSRKFVGVMKSIDFNELVVDLRQTDEAGVLTRVDEILTRGQTIREQLQASMASIRASVLSLFSSDEISRLIN